jgi:hypothetical protein
VIERAERDRRIEGSVGEVKGASVSNERGKWLVGGASLGLRHMKCDRINEDDLVALGSKPRGITTGATADVEHTSRRVRQIPAQQDLGPRVFEESVAGGEATVLTASFVVLRYLASDRGQCFSHRRMLIFPNHRDDWA